MKIVEDNNVLGNEYMDVLRSFISFPDCSRMLCFARIQ